MLKKLCPDELEDIGDLIYELAKHCYDFQEERELPTQEIIYCLIFLSIDLGVENFENPKDLKKLFDFVFKKVKIRRKSKD